MVTGQPAHYFSTVNSNHLSLISGGGNPFNEEEGSEALFEGQDLLLALITV